MTQVEVLESGKRVLQLESAAIMRTVDRLGPSFVAAVDLLASCSGRVLVSGVGKSGHIGRKIAATLTSTGTPATFLHPVDSLHGDLGLVNRGDAAILISKSGRSEELLTLIEHLARLGVQTIALTSDMESPLARHAFAAIDASVSEEACPHNLAPTTSTTVALALGDAIAVALLLRKGFKAEDFARIHPGGALGRRLLLTVAEVMVTTNLPVLAADSDMRALVVTLAKKRGIAMIAGEGGRLHGVITAGDLARAIEREPDIFAVSISSMMTTSPRVCGPGELGSAVVYRMEQQGLIVMPVVGDDSVIVGVVHLHDLMRAGAA